MGAARFGHIASTGEFFLSYLPKGMGIHSVSRAPPQNARRRTKTTGTDSYGRGRRKTGHPIIPFPAPIFGPRREDSGLVCCPHASAMTGPRPVLCDDFSPSHANHTKATR